MSWASPQDLQERKGAERVQRLEADAAKVQRALDDAWDLARSYLLGRYREDQLPAASAAAPGQLLEAVCDVALWYLAGRFDQVEEQLEARFQAAVRYFQAVQRNAADLGLPDSPPADRSRPRVLKTRDASEKRLSREALASW